MVKVAVLDYGIGNLRSAQKAFEISGAEAHLTADKDLVLTSDGVVLPGVGNFGKCAKALTDSGVRELALLAVENGLPFLGICVGMQLLYETSDESPSAKGLGLFSGKVKMLKMLQEFRRCNGIKYNSKTTHHCSKVRRRVVLFRSFICCGTNHLESITHCNMHLRLICHCCSSKGFNIWNTVPPRKVR